MSHSIKILLENPNTIVFEGIKTIWSSFTPFPEGVSRKCQSVYDKLITQEALKVIKEADEYGFFSQIIIEPYVKGAETSRVKKIKAYLKKMYPSDQDDLLSKIAFFNEKVQRIWLQMKNTVPKMPAFSLDAIPLAIENYNKKVYLLNVKDIWKTAIKLNMDQSPDIKNNQINSIDSISDEQLKIEFKTYLNENKEKIISLISLKLQRTIPQPTIFPDELCTLTCLKVLVFSDVKFKTHPDSIGKLTELRHLEILWSKITTLPDSIGKLTNLTNLTLSHNELTTLPDSIGGLTKLESLNLSENYLTTLPDSIEGLTKLERLDLSANKIIALPDSIGKLTNLLRLRLTANKIIALPDSIGKLTKLERLDLAVNHLTTLPNSIGGLTNLLQLNSMGNFLTTLPESIGKLTNLKELYLSDNKLSILPDSIKELTKIERLDLTENEFTTLPDSIGKVTNLKSELEWQSHIKK